MICLALVDAGWRILYYPSVIVYHQRRPIWRRHLAQIGNVGLHRGFFVKKYPRTSLRVSYFLPTIGTALLTLLLLAAIVDSRAQIALATVLAGYLTIGVAISLSEQTERSVAIAVPVVALASHLVYGLQFIRGLLTPDLKR